ncbi:MAG TPA: hypothetical protein VFK47_20360 [Ktedonobacteraceae bacterium]|nr:hypothetical protein [Ktedonobacteraceae bacterium]
MNFEYISGPCAPVQHVSQIPKEMAAGIVMGQLVGQKVVIFDPDTGTIENFITPSVADASFRPVGLQFSPDGKDLYMASLEVHEVRKVTPTGAILPTHEEWPYAMTGVIWKVTHTEAGK